ncbi:MAG TPA: acyl-CoA dehydratase activase [Planctomycetota bacterium]|nr:acyl-CoA dehydratase activase [Planctomycetota bacterium]
MAHRLVAGIDVGSTTCKVVLADGPDVVGSAIAATGANSQKTVERLLSGLLADCGRRRAGLACVVSTGYGRRLVRSADQIVSEITAIARGAAALSGRGKPPRTVIDIGGQDSKVISLDEWGILRDFTMNDKCAAGTGRFLEVMARAMEVELDALGSLSLRAEKVLPVNSLCTVFAESEVISLLSRGEEVCDIVAGIHASIAKRVAAMARKVCVAGRVVFVGGPALNAGLRRALEMELGVKLFVPKQPQLVAAFGAAEIAAAGGAARGGAAAADER